MAGSTVQQWGQWPGEAAAIKAWFGEYALWMNTHPQGIEERGWHNNHSIPDNELWRFELADGRSMKRGIEFLSPYVTNQQAWPYAQDIQYWENLSVRPPFLLYGGLALDRCDWFDLALQQPATRMFTR